MNKLVVYEYIILWHPTEKQAKDEGAKSKIIKDRETVLVKDAQGALMHASMHIPVEYQQELDQVEIAVRPF